MSYLRISMITLLALGSTSIQTQPAYDELAVAEATLQAMIDQLHSGQRLLSEIRSLRKTVDIMTPLLADRSRASTGDVNGDGLKNTKDLSLIYLCQGVPATQPNGPAWFADMDRDGDVDSADIQLLNFKLKNQ